MDYTFNLELVVSDPAALYKVAFEQALKDGLDPSDAIETLNPGPVGDKEIDVAACLQMVLDPGDSPDGTAIQNSSVEGPA